MSIVETFQRAHIERQLRIKQAAFRHLENMAAFTIKPPVAPIGPYRPTHADETAWHVAICGQEKSEPIVERLKIETIQRAVCAHFGIALQDLLSARRTQNLVIPRQVAAYLAKTMTAKSLPEIGRRFGGRDHTTMLHAVRKMERLRQTDPDMQETIEVIARQLGGGLE